MAIRVTHGDVGTFAQFGLEAGKGEQKVRQAAAAGAAKEQAAARDAQIIAAQINATANVNKSIIDAQSRQSAMEFESFMRAESAKRAIGWEQEKFETAQRHDFDMLRQRSEVENQLQLADDLKAKAMLQRKKEALDKAVENGTLSESEANREKVRLDIGVPGSLSPIFGKKSESDLFAQFLSGREGAEQKGRIDATTGRIDPKSLIVKPETTKLFELKDSKELSAEDKTEINALLKSDASETEMRQARELVEAKIRAADEARSNRIHAAAFESPLHRQSMGSFR